VNYIAALENGVLNPGVLKVVALWEALAVEPNALLASFRKVETRVLTARLGSKD
jgi:hypothetical protein